jgi:hypothetical protein
MCFFDASRYAFQDKDTARIKERVIETEITTRQAQMGTESMAETAPHNKDRQRNKSRDCKSSTEI